MAGLDTAFLVAFEDGGFVTFGHEQCLCFGAWRLCGFSSQTGLGLGGFPEVPPRT